MIATLAGSEVRVTQRATGVRLATLQAPGADQLAVSDRWVASAAPARRDVIEAVPLAGGAAAARRRGEAPDAARPPRARRRPDRLPHAEQRPTPGSSRSTSRPARARRCARATASASPTRRCSGRGCCTSRRRSGPSARARRRAPDEVARSDTSSAGSGYSRRQGVHHQARPASSCAPAATPAERVRPEDDDAVDYRPCRGRGLRDPPAHSRAGTPRDRASLRVGLSLSARAASSRAPSATTASASPSSSAR